MRHEQSFYEQLALRARLLPRRPRRELVAAVIIGVIGVAFRPRPGGVVRVHLLVELLPQVLIHDRLLRRRQPPFLLPPVDPLRDAVLHVLGIGDDLHRAALLKRAQPFDRRAQFHAVVGRVRLAAPQLLLLIAVAQDRRPTARSGISGARAVRDQLYSFHCASTASAWRWKNASTWSRTPPASCA